MISKLRLLQNSAAHMLTRKRSDNTLILNTFHWLPARLRIGFKVLLWVFQTPNVPHPANWSELLLRYESPRSLWSFGKDPSIIPKIRAKTYQDAWFSFCSPCLWNILPKDLRAAESVTCFKGAVCNDYGDLLREMEYNTYNYVVSAI